MATEEITATEELTLMTISELIDEFEENSKELEYDSLERKSYLEGLYEDIFFKVKHLRQDISPKKTE
jgi:hypothetical protein